MTVTMRKLGRMGRFGNQLFQYAYLRLLCSDYQCPPWIGQRLFGHEDPPVTLRLPRITQEKCYDWDKSPLNGRDNIDAKAYCAFHTSCYAGREAEFCALFQPLESVRRIVDPPVQRLRLIGNTVVGLHLRRGDYGTFKRKSARWAFVAPTIWYRRWLDYWLPRLDRPVIVIATDEPERVLPDFMEYTVHTVPESPDWAPFYGDFYTLSQCDIILTSNSTFSFAASMLACENKQWLMRFWRPRLSKEELINYNPWNAYPVLTDERY